jgi:hypothetical protein
MIFEESISAGSPVLFREQDQCEKSMCWVGMIIASELTEGLIIVYNFGSSTATLGLSEGERYEPLVDQRCLKARRSSGGEVILEGGGDRSQVSLARPLDD